jgi:type VI secretion system protein VasI
MTRSSSASDAAALVVRCAEKTTSIYVVYSGLASNTRALTPIRYRVGDQPPQSSAWAGSQDYKSYGLWKSEQAVPFIKQMLKAPDFFVRGETESFGTTEASFKLEGLEEAVKPVRETCKW